MNADELRRIQDIERRLAAVEKRQEKDFSWLIGMTLSYIRPLIAVVSAGLQSGAIRAEDALPLVPENFKEEGKDREAESDRKSIASWAGLHEDEED